MVNNQEKIVLAAIGIDIHIQDNMLFASYGLPSYRKYENILWDDTPRLEAEFRFLSKKLDVLIKQHLKKLDIYYDQNKAIYSGVGGLKYNGNIFFLKELHNEEARGVPVSPSNDDSLGCKFFMYRLITSSKAYNIKDAEGNSQSREYKISPTHIVTFDKKTNKSYSAVDVMTQFKYVDESGNDIETHIGNGVNRKAFNVMVAEREGLKNIIKDVFAQYQMHCNRLKIVDDAYKEAMIKVTCASIYEHGDQDYFIQYVTCRELFTLASLDDLCPIKHETTDYFDEL